MRVLITGATGMVGRNLTLKCVGDGFDCAIISRDTELSHSFFEDKVTHIKLDSDFSVCREEIKAFRPQIVLHLAAYLTESDDCDSMLKLIDANIRFPCLVLDSLKGLAPLYFINTGTFAEYHSKEVEECVSYLYSATKTAFRNLLNYYSQQMGFSYVTVVPYTIYGGRETRKKVMDIIYSSLGSPVPIELTSGEQVLDFIHIEDVTDFYIIILRNIEKLESRKTYYLGSGHGVSLKHLADLFESISGKKPNISWGAKPYRDRDIMHAVADLTYIKRDLGWTPKILIERGIKQYLLTKHDDE